MKKFFAFCLLTLATLFTFNNLYAQVLDTPMESSAFFELLIKSLGGLKGASTLAIVGIVVKLLVAFANSELFGKVFKNLTGAWKITIILFLSLVGGVVSLMTVNGLEFAAALVHSTTMGSFLVLTNQLYKQFFEKVD